jgi:hypothetical protein
MASRILRLMETSLPTIRCFTSCCVIVDPPTRVSWRVTSE